MSPILDELDDGEFDLSGCEVEEKPTRPEADLVVVGSASAVQIAITAHEPIDSSAEWDEVRHFAQAHLPRMACLSAIREHEVTLAQTGCRSLGDVRRLPRVGVINDGKGQFAPAVSYEER